jgi:DNA-directed RNA polymerase
MKTYREEPYRLVKRIEQPALVRRVDLPLLVPPQPWTTAEKVGMGLGLASAVTLAVCALVRASNAA